MNERPNPLPDLSDYAGRWVALVAGQVVGVGETGAAALRAARRNRPKDKNLTVQFAEAAGGAPLALSPLLDELAPIFSGLDAAVYLVGGAVRDAVLGEASQDLDFAVAGDALRLTFRVADALNMPAYVLDREREVGRVVLAEHGSALDFARFRADDLTADLYDRDFTLNAMALPAAARTAASIIDPFGGLADIAGKIVRQVHGASMQNDPIRGLRAVRMALRFGFALTAETEASASQSVSLLDQTSAERVRDELLNLLRTQPAAAIVELDRLEMLPRLLPEVKPEVAKAMAEQALTVEAAIAAAELGGISVPLVAHLARPVTGGLDGRLLLRLAAVLHHAERVEPRLRTLRLSNEAVEHITLTHRAMEALAALLVSPSDREAFRFFRQFELAGVDACLLAAAWRGEGLRRLLAHYFGRYAPAMRPRPWLNGTEVMEELGLAAGPEIGRLLRLLEEAQVLGELDTREEALMLLQQAAQG